MRLNPENTFHPLRRRDWRAWLRKNYKTAPEVWVVFFKKHTGKQRVSYNDAVEEALCFGWIDSTVKTVDDQRFAQRFSPRNPKTPYSQSNQERLKALIEHGQVAKDILATLNGKIDGKFSVPPDILKAIKKDAGAWRNFRKLPKSYIRIRVAFIDGARRRPAEFQKRLNYFIRMTAKNKQFGFGGIEKYY